MGRIEYLVMCSVQCHKWLIRSLKTVRAVQRDTEKWLESWSHKFMSGRRVPGCWQTQPFCCDRPKKSGHDGFSFDVVYPTLC